MTCRTCRHTAYVFTCTETQCVQRQKLLASGVLVVGAPSDNWVPYLYVRSGATWTEQRKSATRCWQVFRGIAVLRRCGGVQPGEAVAAKSRREDRSGDTVRRDARSF